MDLPFTLIDMVIHFDTYLPGIITTYGFWTYFILFAIIFCETGLVVFPYLPGDSLLFVAGALIRCWSSQGGNPDTPSYCCSGDRRLGQLLDWSYHGNESI